MTRLVVPKRSYAATHREARSYDREGDAYQDRVAKYIPAEVVAGYVSLDGLLSPAPTRDAVAPIPAIGAEQVDAPSLLMSMFGNVSGIIFLLCLILAPLYVWHLARRAGITAWKMQALIATLAFVVWAYAIKGAVFFQNSALDQWAQLTLDVPKFYDPNIGAALLILFSLIVGFYQPKERD